MPSFNVMKSNLVSAGIFVCSMLVSLGSSSRFEEVTEAAIGSSPVVMVFAESVPASTKPAVEEQRRSETAPYRLFPALLRGYRPAFSGGGEVPPAGYGPVPPALRKARAVADAQLAESAAERQPILAGNQILAFYGKPNSPSMGILGEYSKEKLAPLLEGYARLYDDANGEFGIVPAFYLIFGTCWPEGDIGILNRTIVESYIEFAAERGWLVFLDHQLGKYGVSDSVRLMLPYLRYPNVHLAIDPEWRTLKPMQEIGSITGTELNEAQGLVDDYLRDNDLPGIRMLVVHQFKPAMIRDSQTVRAGYDRVVLVHTADGFGSPPLKKNTYATNARSMNMPVKGFKLFFESKVIGAGWDKPLMKPEEVLALDPMPMVVMYQ
jgi:hypothetical protein